jgi:hypothetical protein
MLECIDGQLTHQTEHSHCGIVWSACCCATLRPCTPYTQHNHLGSSGHSPEHAQTERCAQSVAMLDALQNVEGSHGATNIEAGVYVTTPDGCKQLDRDTIKLVDGAVFMEIKCSRKFAALCGADHPNAHSLENNSFLQTLRKHRHDATTALMEAAHEASGTTGRFVRKFLFDDIKTTINVVCPGFSHDGEDVPEHTVKMLTAQYHNSRMSFELSPENFDYIRNGVRHTMFDEPARKRKDKNSPPEFVACPAARLRGDRLAVYCRVRNADGKWSMKTFPVKFSDKPDLLEERQINAAMSAQCHFDAHHVPAPTRDSRGKKSRVSSDTEGDELVSVEDPGEEKDAGDDVHMGGWVAAGSEAAEAAEAAEQDDWPEDRPNEPASASGVNDGS